MSKHKDVLMMPQSRLRKAAAATSVLDQEDAFQMPQLRNKRKTMDSPTKIMDKVVKRPALGNVTNAVQMNQQENGGCGMVVKPILQTAVSAAAANKKKDILQQIDNLQIENQKPKNDKPVTRASSRKRVAPLVDSKLPSSKISVKEEQSLPKKITAAKKRQQFEESKTKEHVTSTTNVQKPSSKPKRRISNEFDRTEDTLYMSAIDFSSDQSSRLSMNATLVEGDPRRRSVMRDSIEEEESADGDKENEDPSATTIKQESLIKHTIVPSPFRRGPVPEGVDDFDASTHPDCYQLSDYAFDVFDYMKSKECEFPVADYIINQPVISKWMRSLLVDWMVEIQESFELNHETLYLAVKLVDLYLSKRQLSKEALQLLGAASLFIACKFDERIPPFIDDILYICDGAYTRKELIEMERSVFRAVHFNLGVPLSYRFLRRYARCARIALPSLTLARYILEYGLMDYETVTRRDSKLAAASLYIALKMLRPSDDAVWSKTLEYYADYRLEDFAEEVVLLNDNLNKKLKTLNTIKKKYAHKIFYEVALKPHLSNQLLFRGTGIDYQNVDQSMTNMVVVKKEEKH